MADRVARGAVGLLRGLAQRGAGFSCRRFDQVAIRRLATLLLGLFLTAACQKAPEDVEIERDSSGDDPQKVEIPIAEPTSSVESVGLEPEADDPYIEAVDLQSELSALVLEPDTGPFPIGEDIEPPRRLGDPGPIEELVAMMRSGDYAWGACIFQVTISDTGEVGDVVFLKPEHLAPEVEQVIIEGVQRWEFSPATRAGEPVAVFYHLLIHHCPYQRIVRNGS